MKISIGARTDVGGRSNNEDCLAVLDSDRVPLRADAVLIVADGMGGRANGEEASAIAVKLVRETVMDLLDPTSEEALPPAEDILAAGLRRANSTVYELSQEHPDMPGMGTTCIAALVSEGILSLAHVGDSRAYIIRDNQIKPLTIDHTYVAEQVRAGNLTLEAAKTSRFRNVITRAIGIAPTVSPDFNTFPLLDKDVIILTTDGLTNTLGEVQIMETVNKSENAQSNATTLVETAKAAGASDNITVIIIRVTADVMSKRLKRSEFIDRTEREKVVEPEPTVEAPKIDTYSADKIRYTRKKRSTESTGFRLVAASALSALLGAAVTAGALYEIGWLRSANVEESSKTVAVGAPLTVPNDVDRMSSSYSLPKQVYYKPIRSDFLILSQEDLYVAPIASDVLIRLSKNGQVITTMPGEPITADSESNGNYYAIDSYDNLYKSDPSDGTITQQATNGGPSRMLAGNLIRPGAIAVDQTGNVFFVEDGQLEVIRPESDLGK